MCKTLKETKDIGKIKMAEKTLINNKKSRKYATINEIVNIWFSIYSMKELKTTTAYSMKQTLTRYVLSDLEDKKINEVTTLQLQEFFSNLRNKHNLKYINFHGLRHSYCSLQINENKNLNILVVSKLIGHSQLSTTLKYLHSNQKLNDNVISIFK